MEESERIHVEKRMKSTYLKSARVSRRTRRVSRDGFRVRSMKTTMDCKPSCLESIGSGDKLTTYSGKSKEQGEPVLEQIRCSFSSNSDVLCRRFVSQSTSVDRSSLRLSAEADVQPVSNVRRRRSGPSTLNISDRYNPAKDMVGEACSRRVSSAGALPSLPPCRKRTSSTCCLQKCR